MAHPLDPPLCSTKLKFPEACHANLAYISYHQLLTLIKFDGHTEQIQAHKIHHHNQVVSRSYESHFEVLEVYLATRHYWIDPLMHHVADT